MTLENYTRSIRTQSAPASAYRALTSGFRDWWTIPDRPISRVGDRAKFAFPPRLSHWTFEATALQPNERVELTCVDAFHLHDELPKEIEREWLGTRAVWTIEPEPDGTRIGFEHVGLNRALLCYDVCAAGWDFFFVDSLRAYLDTGKGQPHRDPTV